MIIQQYKTPEIVETSHKETKDEKEIYLTQIDFTKQIKIKAYELNNIRRYLSTILETNQSNINITTKTKCD